MAERSRIEAEISPERNIDIFFRISDLDDRRKTREGKAIYRRRLAQNEIIPNLVPG